VRYLVGRPTDLASSSSWNSSWTNIQLYYFAHNFPTSITSEKSKVTFQSIVR
ncbi:20131_t:CDS:1, partial [Rhizophagus irregularis]